MRHRIRLAAVAGFSLLAGACASTGPRPPATWDGLEYRSGTETGVVYARPGASLQDYRTVMIDPLVVATAKDWFPMRNIETGTIAGAHPISRDELKRIEDTIGPVFRDIVLEELATAGYVAVDRARDDTLRVSAGLADVFINTPSSSIGRLNELDSMTLVMTLSDARTGEPLTRLVDAKRGKFGTLEMPNSVANNTDFRRAIRDWADLLRQELDRAPRAP